jgi:DNA-directed RNA polymerase specialized sigma subunit
MTTKEYLAQAYRIDQRINSKLEQIVSLRDLATKATSTLSDTPGKATRNVHSMEGIITKMIDLEVEINKDIDTLVDLKKEIMGFIKNINNPEHQTLLELRYLCFKTWEQIAVNMGYSIQNAYKIHDRALEKINILKE